MTFMGDFGGFLTQEFDYHVFKFLKKSGLFARWAVATTCVFIN